ncbi:uncharacterized protein LOC131011641 isoform X1 [Salvia miltiorrhiza]|uniref:uncharacterized protein LOC131011641 isoform X1 n=1 Tax=Salvia miltiorrhiza TaxID=226208 RepID=UPI0025AC4101|nr:uncharacterized protein LOC131011641 isoform X1 [Salvia miltiorrhiza]
MDFHCMKRKQLQALCKKHKIPANLSNLQMINRLTDFLQEQEDNVSEIESTGEVVSKTGKKVRFSPEHELIEFTRSPEIIKRSRRNSMGRHSSTMQTGELKLMEAEVKQKKRGRKAVKCNDGQKIASAVDSFEDGALETEEGDVVRSGRMTRLRGKMVAEGVSNASKREGKGDDKRGEKAPDKVKNDERQEEIVENHSRVTRSRAQKLTEAPAAEEKRGRKVVKNIGKAAPVRAETGDNADSLSKRGDESEGKSDERRKGNEKGLKESLVNKQIAGEHATVEPQIRFRRSKRRANGVDESEMFTIDTRKHENAEVKGSRKTSKLSASGVSKVDTEISGLEANPGRRVVLKFEEPIQKMEPRRSNRRKTMIASDSLRVDTLRSSLPQSDIVPEVSKDEKIVIQPIGIMRRSRRKTLSLKLVSATDTDSAVENLEAEKHISESCLVEKENYAVEKKTRLTRNTSKCKPPGSLDKISGDSNIHQKNKVMKRKRGHVTGDVIKNHNDQISEEQSLKGSSSEKVVSSADTGIFADEKNQPHRLDKPNMLDASSHRDSSGIGESLFLDVQLSVSKDSENANKPCSKNIISDVDLTFIRDTCEKKEAVSVADSADSSCMNLANEEDFVKSATNAASRSAELGIESSVSEDQISSSKTVEVEKGKLLMEFDVQESVEQNITGVDKDDPGAQVYSQADDSGCNNKINDQVLEEGLYVSGEEGSAETHTSADSFLLGDQTHVKTDLEVAETAVDERVQPCLRVDDCHNDLDHLGSPSNILDNNNEGTSQTSGEDGAFESCGTHYTHSKSTSKLKAPSLGMTRHHGDNVAEGNETFFHKGGASEQAEADEGGCSKDQRNASDHFSESYMPDLCHGERDARTVSPDRGIFPGEYLVMNSEEHCTDSTCVNQKRGIDSDVVETRESESSKGHKSKRDEDGEFCLVNLFDEEGRYGITPQVEENFSGEHSVKNFDEQGMSHGSPSIAPTTICNSTGDHKANLSTEGGEAYHFENKQLELTEADESECLKSDKSSNSQETNPSTPSNVSETKAENQKSLLAKSSALAYANQRQGTWSNESELAGNAVCFLKSSEGKISQIAEGLIADEDVNHENYGTDKEVSAEASISDVKSCPVSKIADESSGGVKFQDTVETEHQHRNLVARQSESDEDEEATPGISRQSWTEAELQNLFGTSDEDASPGLSDTFCEGSETANMTISKNISTASNSSGILTKKQEKEREGENGIESDVDIYAVKVTTPYKTEENYFHDRVLDGSVTSIKECSEAMKENVAAGSTSYEKAQNIGYEIENNLGIGASLSDNGGDDICEDTNEVERFELLNTSTGVLSGAEYDGCEALEDQLTHRKEECLQEIISVTQEDREGHVIPLAESCLNDEATEKSFINASGSQRNFYELESCTHMSEICTISELSDADPQKSVVPESSHLPTACSNDGDILRETLIETSSDPEVAKIGSSKKGISPLVSLKASPDSKESIFESDDQYEAKKLDEKVGDSTSSQDISDELHTNSEVAIQESVSTGYNICRELDHLVSSDELESTCKEAKGREMTTQTLSNSDVVAEHGSFVSGAVSGLLSNSPMHINLGYHGSGDKKLEAGEPVSSLDEEKVQEAGFELGNSLGLGDLLSDDGGEDTCGKMNDVESVGLEVTFTRTEYDGCEASEGQLTENTGECQKGTDFIAEDNEEKVVPLGQSYLYDGETDSDSESTQENTNSLFGTPNNLDKLGGCQDMLIDTALSESVSCKSRVYHKSEQEMIQSGEGAVELSDADLQKSNISEINQNVIDEGTYLLLSSKASPVYDELTESTDTDDLNGAKICDEMNTKAKSCQEDMTNESHINSEVAIQKHVSDTNGQSEEAGLACSLELESTFLETKETGTTTQYPNNVAAPTDLSSSVCGAELHIHLRGENNDIENLDMWKPVFNLSGDNDKKDSGRTEENPTAQIVQFPIHELHFEENAEDFENDTHIMSNLPASSGYDSILRESDVADTIKEYIDSESSLPVIFENSGAGLPSDMLADTDEGFGSEKPASPYEKDIAARLDSLTPTMKISCDSSSKDKDNVPMVDCLNTEIKEQEKATSSTRPSQVSRNAANLPERVDEEGTSVKLEGGEDGQSSTMRKNARTILIHGTPGKLLAMADMKENMPMQKRSNVADITAVRPAKRRALRDLQ